VTLPEEWAGLRWPVRRGYKIVMPGDPLFVPVHSPSLGADDRAWTEGMFTPTGDVNVYDPASQAGAALDAALRVQVHAPASLTTFVDQWGLLGVGLGTTEGEMSLATQPQVVLQFDTVWATRRALSELQRHFAWLRALRDRNGRAPEVPGLWLDEAQCLEAARALLPAPLRGGLSRRELRRAGSFGHPDPYIAAFAKGHRIAAIANNRRLTSVREREPTHWAAFSQSISPHLRLVHPTIRWMKDRSAAAWAVRRLADVLWVALWDLATGGASIRRCRHCRRWFPVDRRGKVYCSRQCTNRASAAASYEARKRARGRPRR
jgi:hypothetical protein